jgi:hypothetical protein
VNGTVRSRAPQASYTAFACAAAERLQNRALDLHPKRVGIEAAAELRADEPEPVAQHEE